ncbi:MAG TPA: SDR family NAD(P)-dependent oxidoreductase [Gemmatirosa sp.]|nr:SDR family NAD(P)-dependent oxidoreductase [Gemmatirosa sp.]
MTAPGRGAPGRGALAGRAAIVTGASRGIGRATAEALAAAGAHVALVSRSAEALEDLAARLRAAHGVAAHVVPCDVRDTAAVDAAVGRLRDALGGAPDVLVNNAGVFPLAPIAETSAVEFAATLDANLVAPFAFVRAFVGDMRARGSGHLVTVGSIADRMTFPENGAYAASKYGLRALHEVLRAELRGSGVRASLVSPGPVDTTLWDAIGPDERPGFTPRALMLRPEAVADAIVWVAAQPAAVNIDELRLTHA